MTNETTTIISKEPVNFKTRFLKSLIAPWVFLWIGILTYFSFKIPFLWIMTTLFVVTFIVMNYKAMEQLLTKAELKNNSIEFTYYNSGMKLEIIKIPINILTVEYYGNGKGISSLVSDHVRIEQKGQTLLKQYKTDGWTLENLKEFTENLNEIKKNKN